MRRTPYQDRLAAHPVDFRITCHAGRAKTPDCRRSLAPPRPARRPPRRGSHLRRPRRPYAAPPSRPHRRLEASRPHPASPGHAKPRNTAAPQHPSIWAFRPPRSPLHQTPRRLATRPKPPSTPPKVPQMPPLAALTAHDERCCVPRHAPRAQRTPQHRCFDYNILWPGSFHNRGIRLSDCNGYILEFTSNEHLCEFHCALTTRATHGTSTGAEPASRAPGGASTVSLDGLAPAHHLDRARLPGNPRPPCGCSPWPWPRRPAQPPASQPSRTASRQRGGASAAGRRLHCIGPPHTPAPLSPIGWTIKGGLNRMDIDGQGEGWTKCSGWPHRRVRRLTGFSTTWVGYGRRIGSGRAVGVRGGTLRGPGIWRSRRLVGGTSGWRGTCRRLRLGTVAPPKKMILLRLRRFGMWSGGVGRGRTRGGRAYRLKAQVGGARGPRSRASSDCRTRAGATSRCERRSATRSAKCCRGRCEDVANADTDDEQIVVNLSGASGGRRPCRQRRWLTSSLVGKRNWIAQ